MRNFWWPILLILALMAPLFFIVALMSLLQGHLYGGWTIFHLLWPIPILMFVLSWVWISLEVRRKNR